MNPLPVEFHPAALADARSAERWYADIEPLLAASFLDELDSAVSLAASTPQRWSPHIAGTRCILLRRFPYLLVYLANVDAIQVIAVQHTRRRPDYWVGRVESK